MKKVIYKAFVVTLLGLAVSTPTIKANDVYVPFGEKKFTEIENSQKIDFDDLNLKEALLEYYKFHINKDYKGEEVTIGMMEQFTSLSLPWKNIFSLKGLEYAVNLKNLNLSNNFIEDITPLEKLVELEIGYEEVEILSSLKNLKQFLYVRDTYKLFEGIQGSMQIGIPCLVINEEDCILNIDDLDKLIH